MQGIIVKDLYPSTMKHPSEEILELYVLEPGSVAPNERSSIEAHLPECVWCSTTVQFLKEFYSTFFETSIEERKNPENPLDDKPVSPGIIRLAYYHPQPPTSALIEHQTISLAASTTQISDDQFQVVGTYAAEFHRTIVRLLFDRINECYRVYVLSDLPQKRQAVLVSFPGLPAQVVTDVNGRASFTLPPHDIPDDWGSIECIVQLPRMEFQISARELADLHRLGELVIEQPLVPYRCQLRKRGDSISLEIFTTAPLHKLPSNVTVEAPDSTVSFFKLRRGKGEVPAESFNNATVLRFYSPAPAHFSGSFCI